MREAGAPARSCARRVAALLSGATVTRWKQSRIWTSFALGLFAAVLNVRYHDVQHAVPFLLQLGLYLSPVAYQTHRCVPEAWRWVYGLNPMAVAIDLFRWSLFVGEPGPHPVGAVLSVAGLLVASAGALHYLRAMERTFADEI